MRIYLDIEATEAGEVIAIGAVTEAGSTFHSYVRPVRTEITDRITVLTGITKEAAADATPLPCAAQALMVWAKANCDGEFQFCAFGKGDKDFLKRSYESLHITGWDYELAEMKDIKFIIDNTTNIAKTIYQAFRKPYIGLRPAYLTYRENKEAPRFHNPLEDAMMLKELVEACEGGWSLPEGKEIVKVHKPTLPPKAKADNGDVPLELRRKVIAYWVKDEKDRCGVYRDCVQAAATVCTKAIQAGITKVDAARRVLNAAYTGESYCGRKFFLVD